MQNSPRREERDAVSKPLRRRELRCKPHCFMRNFRSGFWQFFCTVRLAFQPIADAPFPDRRLCAFRRIVRASLRAVSGPASNLCRRP